MTNITEWAASGTDLAHNHKGRCAIAKTFMQIGTGGLFTDRGHFMLAQNILDGLHFGGGREAYAHPLGLALDIDCRNHLDWNPLHFVGTAQFFTLLQATSALWWCDGFSSHNKPLCKFV